jgi:hypothetical protein
VARFGELADVSLSLGRPDELIVSMPNMIDIEGWENKVKDLSIRPVFLPIDDPEQRAMYQFWMHHPDDAKARAWYQETIAGQIHSEVPTGGVRGKGADQD